MFLNKKNTINIFIVLVCWIFGFYLIFDQSLIVNENKKTELMNYDYSSGAEYFNNFLDIILNNIVVALIVSVLGYLTFGIITILVSIYNGVILALSINLFLEKYNSNLLYKVVLHVPSEILAFCCIGAIGLLGFNNIKYIMKNEKINYSIPPVKLFIFPVFLLFVSAFIEAGIPHFLFNNFFSMNVNFSPVIKQLLLLFAISLIISIIKNEVILHFCFSKEYILPSRLSSLMSSGVSNAITMISLFILLAIVWYLMKIANFNIDPNVYVDSSKNFITVFFFSEIIKFALIWIILIDEIKGLNYEDYEFKSKILHTEFIQYVNHINIVAIIVANLTFGYFLYQSQIKFNAILFSCSILLSLLSITFLL